MKIFIIGEHLQNDEHVVFEKLHFWSLMHIEDVFEHERMNTKELTYPLNHIRPVYACYVYPGGC